MMTREENQPITQHSFSLHGKTALVTGASRGIGRALSVGLAQAGAKVVLSGRSEGHLEQVADEIGNTGNVGDPAPPAILKLDVTDFDTIHDTITNCPALSNGLDILINNAGFESVADSLKVTPSLWDSIVDTNLKGAFFVAQTGAAMMLGNGGKGGSIINVCSLSSSVGIPTAAPYTSSKSGLLGMTRALSSEWAPQGIRVNGIAPGYFRTEMTEGFFQDSEWAKAMLSRIPIGRFGRLEDLIGAVVFFCSPAASYITGQMLTIDGGYLASI